MSVLEKIRSKTGLLVGLVGLALIIFVLQSALETGNSLFGSNERTVGTIAGKNIDYMEFSQKVNDMVTQYQASGQQVDDQMKQNIIEQSWNQLINERVMKTQFDKLGITVTNEELYDLMLVNPHAYVTQYFTDRQTGKVYEQFAKADGTLDLVKLNSFVQQMTPEQEKFWKSLEDQIREVRLVEKYNGLIKKGVYATTAQARNDYMAQTHSMNMKFVVKRYSSLADSAVQVTDEEIRKYYNENQYLFKNEEATRKIEYLVWDAIPSNEDVEDIKKEMATVAEDFRNAKTESEDSALMKEKNENELVDVGMFKKGMISPEIDSTAFYTAPKGSVFGPYQENNTIKVSKLEDVVSVADSGKVRHILIGYTGSIQGQDIKRDKGQAKKLADSLVNVLKQGGNFDKLVDTYSEDGGKKKPDLSNPQVKSQIARFFPNPKDTNTWKGKGGNYGWIREGSREWVESFVKGATEHKKGDIFVAESNFGYHIMEVLDVSKGTTTKYKVATITQKIEPSDATRQKFYAEATDFSGKNNTKDLFDKAVDAQKLNKRIADNIKESDRTIAGIENPKELIRWAYAAKKGDVSQAYEFGNRFVVATVSDIKEKGTAPLEQVKEDVTMKVKKDKKAEQFTKELSDKMAGVKSVADLALKVNLPAERAENILFSSYSVTGVGREDALCGAASVAKPNVISAKPLKGDIGVYVYEIESVKDVPVKDYKATQKSSTMSMASRVDYEVSEALKQLANIEDHKAKFDF
ncbi:MAG: SurA N-terminal domain-containing protein [Bacteroidia bacterium]